MCIENRNGKEKISSDEDRKREREGEKERKIGNRKIRKNKPREK